MNATKDSRDLLFHSGCTWFTNTRDGVRVFFVESDIISRGLVSGVIPRYTKKGEKRFVVSINQ